LAVSGNARQIKALSVAAESFLKPTLQTSHLSAPAVVQVLQLVAQARVHCPTPLPSAESATAFFGLVNPSGHKVGSWVEPVLI